MRALPAFTQKVFGWNIRKRGDGSVAFDDTVGDVSGAWVLGRPPAATPGLLFYVMIDSVAATVETVEAVIANGGEIVQPIGADAPKSPPGGSALLPLQDRRSAVDNLQRLCHERPRGAPLGFATISQDITRQKWVQEQLQEKAARVSRRLFRLPHSQP